MTCKNAWRKLVDFEQNVIEAAIDQWHESMRAGGGHFEHMLQIVYLYYVVHQNILWNCQCLLVHLTAIL